MMLFSMANSIIQRHSGSNVFVLASLRTKRTPANITTMCKILAKKPYINAKDLLDRILRKLYDLSWSIMPLNPQVRLCNLYDFQSVQYVIWHARRSWRTL